MSTATNGRVGADDVRQAAAGNWRDILTNHFGMSAAILDGQHHPCPQCGGKDRFRAFDDFDQMGGVICNHCHPDRNADGFATIKWLTGIDFPAAINLVADYLGMEHRVGDKSGTSQEPKAAKSKPIEEPSKEQVADEIAKHSRKMVELWQRSEPDNGRIAEYLRHRGLDMEVPPTLRLLEAEVYWEKGDNGQLVSRGKFPVMLTQLVRPNGRVAGIHRTYLASDGPGKAAVPSPKKLTNSPVKVSGWHAGAAIQLYDAVDVVALTEGIETALAVHKITGLPTWATYSSNNLKTVDLPPRIRSVEIWGDSGEAGEQAAHKAAERLLALGHKVKVVLPNADYSDWLDVYIGSETEF